MVKSQEYEVDYRCSKCDIGTTYIFSHINMPDVDFLAGGVFFKYVVNRIVELYNKGRCTRCAAPYVITRIGIRIDN